MRRTEGVGPGGAWSARAGTALLIALSATAARPMGCAGLRVARAEDPHVERRLKRPGIHRKKQLAIDGAIGRASAYLRRHQREDGAFVSVAGEHEDTTDPAFAGQSLLCALALQKVDSRANADAVDRAARWCLASDPSRLRRVERFVYAAGIGLTLVCDLPSSTFAEARSRLANALVAGQDRATGWWGYDTPGGDVDLAYATKERGPATKASAFDAFEPNLSTTQYAVMGLRAVARWGADVPRRVWSRHVDGMLKTQTPSGSWPYRPVDTGESTRAFDRVGYCCGTFMGLSSLVTGAEFERAVDRRPSGRQVAVADAISRARAALWRDGRLSLKDPWIFDPDAIERERIARSREDSASFGTGAFYTLLALERACVFSGVDRLGNPVAGRIPDDEQKRLDAEGMWYAVGAGWLLQRQAADGGWATKPAAERSSNLRDSAMGLLFLLGSVDDGPLSAPQTPSEPRDEADR